jgi:hypothetical protein
MKHKRILTSVVMAAVVLVSLCALSASALSISPSSSSSSSAQMVGVPAWSSGSNVQAPTLVGAPVGAGAPGVCSQDGKGLDLFIRGADNALYWKESADGTTWPSTLASLNGTLTSAPCAVSTSLGSIDVFVRGTDSRLWEKNTTDGGVTWSAWTSVAPHGTIAANSAPSVVAYGSAGLSAFIRGTDNALWWATSTNGGSSWSAWSSLKGVLTSAPGATATKAGEIGVFVAGSDGAVWYKHYLSGSWNTWASVGGNILTGTSPAAYNWGSSQIGWLYTGSDSHLYRGWAGNTQGLENVGGVLTSSPSATAKANGFIDAFGRGSSGQFAALYQNSFNYPRYPGGWGVWTALGGV